MELNAEARRILAVSISKLYASRSQRGGLRLHRSLLVSLVMKSARDIYHSSAAAMERGSGAAPGSTELAMEAMDTSEPREESHSPREESHSPREESQRPAETQPREDRDYRRETQPRELRGSAEDKENRSPQRPSRKRPGKASAAPAFLPEKRARLEPGEERHEAAASPSSCRGAQTLTALPFNRVISAF